MIYNEGNVVDVPSVDLLTFLFESEHCGAQEASPLHAEANDPDRVLTKRDARIITQQIALWLRQQFGIGETGSGKDTVVAFSNGQTGLACLFYGVVAAGGVYSASSTMLAAKQLAGQIMHGSSKVLVCSEDVLDTALEAAELAGLCKRSVVVLRTGSLPNVSLEAADGSARWSYEPDLPRLSWKKITDPEVLENTCISLVYSSGTTGIPKGVRISHANMVAEAFLPAYLNRPIWDNWAASGRPFSYRTLAHLGCAHISGVQGYLVNPVYDGGIVYWMPRFDLVAFLKYTSELKITSFFSLPRVFAALAFLPNVTTQLSSLRIAYSGSSPLDPKVYASTKFGGEGEERTLLSQTWGATETTGAVTHMPPDRRDTTGSVGVLLPNIQMRLVKEDGKDTEAGERGEAWLKGPIITKGYHLDDNLNQATFEDGWYRTGDLVELKGDMVYILGRIKELIKYNGHTIPPAELEVLLLKHPAVQDVAVLGVSENEATLLRALVVPRPGSATDEATKTEIVAFLDKQVPDHKRLRGRVQFVQEIPRFLSGKVCREKLHDLLQ